MRNRGSILTREQFLSVDDFLVADNGNSFAIMQGDGNFVVYRGTGPSDSHGPVWASGTDGSGQCFAIMQGDGNFVVYRGTGPSDSHGPVWASGTAGSGECFAIMQGDGNFVIYRGTGSSDSHGAVWASGTVSDASQDPVGVQNWMSSIPDDTVISALTIPGTHDSGTYCMQDKLMPYCKTQDKTIAQQLNMGIRFLDIRGRLEPCPGAGPAIRIVHAKFPTEIWLQDVLTDCYHFLQNHPSETILLSLREDAGPTDNWHYEIRSIATIFAKLYYAAKPSLYWGRGDEAKILPRLSDVRGKIVLLARSGFKDGDLGIKLPISDNRTDINPSNPSKDDIIVYCEDRYTPDTVGEKFNQIAYHLDFVSKRINGNRSLPDGRNAQAKEIYLTFTSATGGEWGPIWDPLPKGPHQWAEEVNPKVAGLIKGDKVGPLGIVPMDFPTEELITVLIQSNSAQLMELA